jgi:hypothetical protein
MRRGGDRPDHVHRPSPAVLRSGQVANRVALDQRGVVDRRVGDAEAVHELVEYGVCGAPSCTCASRIAAISAT